MRSFIGAFKVFSRIIPGCSTLMVNLDDTIADCESKQMTQWTDNLLASFHKAQSALTIAHTISLPIPSDQPWIVINGALCKPRIGTTLNVTHNDKLRPAGFSSTKLRGSQWTLLPCEIEALAITVATKHFSPYLVQSHHEACILTKSKPCIQAYEKTLQRRVSSKPPCIYLSVHREPLSGFCKTRIWLCNTTFRFLAVQLRVTIKPARSVPSQGSHRILLSDARQSKTYSVAMSVYFPFTSCTAWLATQAECPDLRATYKCIHREPLSGFCKTRIWLYHTTFRFVHSQSSSVWG